MEPVVSFTPRQYYPSGKNPTNGTEQGRPLGGASEALAPGADFEGPPKRRSPTGHTLIRSIVAR
jgi:hypothetical protein